MTMNTKSNFASPDMGEKGSGVLLMGWLFPFESKICDLELAYAHYSFVINMVDISSLKGIVNLSNRCMLFLNGNSIFLLLEHFYGIYLYNGRGVFIYFRNENIYLYMYIYSVSIIYCFNINVIKRNDYNIILKKLKVLF